MASASLKRLEKRIKQYHRQRYYTNYTRGANKETDLEKNFLSLSLLDGRLQLFGKGGGEGLRGSGSTEPKGGGRNRQDWKNNGP